MGKQLKVITWARWTVSDPFSPEFYTIFTASILKPSWEFPIACASMSIRKGRNKVFLRMPYEALRDTFVIPDVYISRLAVAYHEAEMQAHNIIEQQKAYHKMSGLAPGSSIVRTDTGEIIAEAQRILAEGL